MDRSIRGLSSHIFVERIPSNALNVVIVLCYLSDQLPYNARLSRRNITTGKNVEVPV